MYISGVNATKKKREHDNMPAIEHCRHACCNKNEPFHLWSPRWAQNLPEFSFKFSLDTLHLITFENIL